ncbi:MAG: SDR family NAD(P)-dependent oxidoreductase [Pseudomonadota bacterium]
MLERPYDVDLATFGDGLKVAVFGASGGIGLAVVDALSSNSRVNTIYAFSRQPIAETNPKVVAKPFDIEREETMVTAAEEVGSPDLVFVATGILHDDAIGLFPEKALRDFNLEDANRVFSINTIGPALIAKHFLPRLSREKKTVFAAISARVGSISDNRLGGWYSYRASKAALNQIIKSAAIEIGRKNKNAICVALHPGTVETGLSAPFKSNVKPDKLFEPAWSAACMLNVLNTLTPDQSGRIFAFDGAEITP